MFKMAVIGGVIVLPLATIVVKAVIVEELDELFEVPTLIWGA